MTSNLPPLWCVWVAACLWTCGCTTDLSEWPAAPQETSIAALPLAREQPSTIVEAVEVPPLPERASTPIDEVAPVEVLPGERPHLGRHGTAPRSQRGRRARTVRLSDDERVAGAGAD
jgi:hypothetical protein